MKSLNIRLIHWRSAVILCLLALVGAGSGCHEQDKGQVLASAGQQTAKTLAVFYDSLAHDALDTWELEAYLSSIRKVPFSIQEQQELAKQISALNSRAGMARQMEATYASLQSLSSYKASDELSTAVGGLETSIQSLTPLPGGSDGSNLLKQAAGVIAGWKQGRDITKNTEELHKVLANLVATFDKEKTTYKSYPLERANKTSAVLRELIRLKYVNPWPLLKDVPESLGLVLKSPDAGPTDDETLEALIAVSEIRQQRLALLSAQAADDELSALNSLAKAHEQFAKKQPITLADILDAEGRAKSYLDEIAKTKVSGK